MLVGKSQCLDLQELGLSNQLRQMHKVWAVNLVYKPQKVWAWFFSMLNCSESCPSTVSMIGRSRLYGYQCPDEVYHSSPE